MAGYRSFVCVEDEMPKVLNLGGLGHKRIVFDDDVATPCAVTFRTNGDDLQVSAEELADEEDCFYTILTKKFGLAGSLLKFSSDINVIVCADGYLLVTLKRGAIIVEADDQLLVPTVGIDTMPDFNEKSVLWVTSDTLMDYIKYYGCQAKFPHDFEFDLTVSGGIGLGGCKDLSIKHNKDDDIDISCGYYAAYLQDEARRVQTEISQSMFDEYRRAIEESRFSDDEPNPAYDGEDDEDDEEYVE